jgi:small basic protein
MTMLIAVIGVIAGILIGFKAPMSIPPEYARYLSIAVLATLDGAFGGIRASLENKFDNTIFVTGFFTNAIIAAGLTLLGDRLGVELYNAAVFALGYRIFQNIGVSRRLLLSGVRIPDEVKLKPKH